MAHIFFFLVDRSIECYASRNKLQNKTVAKCDQNQNLIIFVIIREYLNRRASQRCVNCFEKEKQFYGSQPDAAIERKI